MSVNPWIRLYRDSLHDPKIVSLNDRQHRVWHNCLLIADDTGALPSMRDIACHLRMSLTDCEQVVHELVDLGLIDVDALTAGPKRLAMHGWAKRQFVSDSSTARVRKHREKMAGHGDEPLPKRRRNVSVTPPEPDTDTDLKTVPREIPRARRSGEQDLNFDFRKGLGGGGQGGPLPGAVLAGGVRTTLTRRAEGLGLPVTDLLAIIDRQKPRNPEAYFRGMCVKRLQDRAPGVADAVLAAALDGQPAAVAAVSSAILLAETAP